MSKLEDAINDALARGEFVHLSVAASGNMFRAVFTSASRAGGHSFAEAADPIVAMVRAITATPMVRKSKVSQTIAVDDEALS